jgi:hypothetical protein
MNLRHGYRCFLERNEEVKMFVIFLFSYRYQGGGGMSGIRALPPAVSSPQSCDSPRPETPKPDVRTPITNFDAATISKKLETGGWDVMLSESSDSENDGDMPRVSYRF